MLKNYIKIAYRNLLKNKVFSVINILGLAIGMAACFLILQYVSFELSYDQFHKHKNEIYRVYMDVYKNGALNTQSARVAPGVASAFHDEFSSIDTYTRMVILGPDGVLTYEDQYIAESDIYLADSAFFDVFSFNLVNGNEHTAFDDPFCVVITELTASRLFGDADPLGKSVVINAKNFDGTSIPFKVTGVIENFPANTHLQPGVLISYPTLFEFVGHQFDNSWQWNETYTYFRLYPNADPEALEAGFPDVVHKKNQQLEEQNLDWRYNLQPVTDIHLYSDLRHELSENGNVFYVGLLVGVGLLILLIAYINFVNLVTVKALQRAKEVGVRKVSGAQRRQLIVQFFLESLLVNIIAFVLAGIMLRTGGPLFSELFDVKLTFILNHHPEIWIGVSIFILLLVLGSGFYPAFVLSHHQPVKILKGVFYQGKSGHVLRSVLVGGQFAIAIVLITLTLAAGMQIRYMQQKLLGFNPEHVVIIKSPKAFDYGYGSNFSGFQTEVSSLARVQHVAASNVVPGQEIYWYDDQVNMNGAKTSGVFSMVAVSQNYFSLYNIPLITGRLFDGHSGEQGKWIINESAMRSLGFDDPEKAIGQQLNNREIIGVVQDFHHESPKAAIAPTLFNCGRTFNYYTVKVESAELESTLEEIKETYTGLFPGSPYEYFFLDKFFNRQYKAERQFNALFSLFSGLAIFIACLGLFGLSSYTIAQRTKEIGIRKVLGASGGNIIAILSKDFIKLVFVAGLLALPAAYLLMQQWLENYAFRIDIGWELLLAPMMIVLLIALVTVSLQSLTAAKVNPVKSLRYE